MTFRVVHRPSNNHARCPYRIVEQATGREVDWLNNYLDYETLRRLADNTLRTYVHELLHFLRWWESVHHIGRLSPRSKEELRQQLKSSLASLQRLPALIRAFFQLPDTRYAAQL